MNTFVFDHELAGVLPPQGDHPLASLQRATDWGPPITGLPMLPPPKRFLLPGSTFHVSTDTTYHFYQEKARKLQNADAVDIKTSKIRIYPDKLQLIQTKFFFKRKTNCMTEVKMGFSMLTYSIEKRALYTIQSLKPNKRWTKAIRRVSLNKFCIKRLETYDKSHKDRWIAALAAAVKRDVPDVYDECSIPQNKIIALIIQHRVGKGIPGLNDLLMDNLGHVVSTTYFNDLVQRDGTTGPTETEVTAAVKRMKQKTVYKFLPALKDTGSMVKAFKALFGKHFNRTLLKIMTHISVHHIGDNALFISRYKDLAPTGAKHMLSRLLKEEEYELANGLVHQIAVVISALKHDNVSPEIVSNWSKTMSRIGTVINWITWKDIYSMAEQLRTRVRPSRFNSLADVNALHDAYTRLIVATGGKGNKLNLPPEELVFLPVDIPEEYNGYKVYQLMSQADLTTESEVLGHCAAGYAEGCMFGRSIIVSLHDLKDEKLWTVQYSGHDFSYIQAEGKVLDLDDGDGVGLTRRVHPSQDIVDSIIKPLGRVIQIRESNKPLSYSMRADLRTKLISMMHGLVVIEKSTLEDNMIEEHIEAVNCQIERVIEVVNLINHKVPPSNEHLLQLVAKIDAEGADRFLTKRSHNLPAVPVGAPAPPAEMLEVAPRAVAYDFEAVPVVAEHCTEQYIPY